MLVVSMSFWQKKKKVLELDPSPHLQNHNPHPIQILKLSFFEL